MCAIKSIFVKMEIYKAGRKKFKYLPSSAKYSGFKSAN